MVTVVSASACLAGHGEDDAFLIDATGVVEPPADGGGICIMALHKIWRRVMRMLERMHTSRGGEENF